MLCLARFGSIALPLFAFISVYCIVTSGLRIAKNCWQARLIALWDRLLSNQV